jgi:uncharacterized membrane protein YfhO
LIYADGGLSLPRSNYFLEKDIEQDWLLSFSCSYYYNNYFAFLIVILTIIYALIAIIKNLDRSKK